MSDVRLDDGLVPHQDFHGGCSETRPDWWGTAFFKHYADSGFVGDIFMINGKAYPKLVVEPRKYRFRLLCASISRIYSLTLMRGNVRAFPGQQGQYNFVNAAGTARGVGTRVMDFRVVATDGGLLPAPVQAQGVELWPGKRREVVIDFSRYANGQPTQPGDEIYLANVAEMLDGRKPNANPNYCVPLMKFVIGPARSVDNSVVPAVLRPMPPLPPATHLRRCRCAGSTWKKIPSMPKTSG